MLLALAKLADFQSSGCTVGLFRVPHGQTVFTLKFVFCQNFRTKWLIQLIVITFKFTASVFLFLTKRTKKINFLNFHFFLIFCWKFHLENRQNWEKNVHQNSHNFCSQYVLKNLKTYLESWSLGAIFFCFLDFSCVRWQKNNCYFKK